MTRGDAILVDRVSCVPEVSDDIPQLVIRAIDPAQDGSHPAPLALSEPGSFVIGRATDADWSVIDLGVSRHHARIELLGGEWLIHDLGSRHGTMVNGRKLATGERVPLRPGDGITFGVWRCRCEEPGHSSTLQSLAAEDVESQISAVPREVLAGVAQVRLDAVLSVTRELAGAASREAVAKIICKSAAAGTSCARVMVVRPVSEVEYEIICGDDHAQDLSLSRSLLRSAAQGNVVQMMGENAPISMQSIVDLKIRTAICVPLMVAGIADSLLYLDSRGSERQLPRDAVAFCNALGEIGGLAIERLLAAEMTARQQQMERDLEAARQAQVLLLPPRIGSHARLSYAFESVAGRHVAGDLFDVVDLPDERVAFFLGDVSGKGVGAGVLMAATQTQFRAALLHGAGLVSALSATNALLFSKTESSKFVTLIAGIWNAAASHVELADAGHGFCCLCRPGGPVKRIDVPGGMPIGLSGDTEYETLILPVEPGTRLVLFSDGVVEQPDAAGAMFGFEAAEVALAASTVPEQDVSSLLEAVRRHADGDFADDLTVASLQFN